MAAVRALKHPTGVLELRQVLGLLTQMRKWVNMFSDKTHSLTHLLKDGVKWDFGPQQQQDFEDLRRAWIESTLNYAPDYSAELILSSDASDWAIESRLFQVIGGTEHTIGFWSPTLTLSQTRPPVYFKELLGVLDPSCPNLTSCNHVQLARRSLVGLRVAAAPRAASARLERAPRAPPRSRAMHTGAARPRRCRRLRRRASITSFVRPSRQPHHHTMPLEEHRVAERTSRKHDDDSRRNSE